MNEMKQISDKIDADWDNAINGLVFETDELATLILMFLDMMENLDLEAVAFQGYSALINFGDSINLNLSTIKGSLGKKS